MWILYDGQTRMKITSTRDSESGRDSSRAYTPWRLRQEMSTPTLVGSVYFLLIVNDYSSKTWVYFILKQAKVVVKVCCTKWERDMEDYEKVPKQLRRWNPISNKEHGIAPTLQFSYFTIDWHPWYILEVKEMANFVWFEALNIDSLHCSSHKLLLNMKEILHIEFFAP